jgi:exosortase
MILTFCPWIILGLLFYPIFFQLYSVRWSQVDYTHAYFILPVVVLMLFSQKELFKTVPLRNTTYSTMAGLILIGLASGMFILGWRHGYLLISTLSFIFFLFGMSLFLLGVPKTRLFVFPFLYLLLLVPIPLGILDQITLPLRYVTSVVVEFFLSLFRYPIHREGLLLSMGQADIYVGQPCSGFRSIITMLSLGLAYIFFTRGNFTHKIILIGSIIPLACIGNYIRVVVICLISYYFGVEAAEGFFHSFSGILMFLIMIFGMLALENFLTRRDIK